MSATSNKKQWNILEAVELLTAVAEIDGRRRSLIEENSSLGDAGKIKDSFRIIHNYLRHVYENKQLALKDQSTRKRIRAMVEVAEEAAGNLSKYTELFKGIHEAKPLQEFENLYAFYLEKLSKRMEKVLLEEESPASSNLETQALRDLETVRKDASYELFYLKDKEGLPYFNRTLLRHVSLVSDMEGLFLKGEEDDPFIKTRGILDKRMNLLASGIYHKLRTHIEAFFKQAFQYKEDPFVSALTKASMALLLCSNQRHLESGLKPCGYYYRDFIAFLRAAYKSASYSSYCHKIPKEGHSLIQESLYLFNEYCLALYTTQINFDEVPHLLKTLVGAGKEEPSFSKQNPLEFWNQLMTKDESLREKLKEYPNGPLMKALDFLTDPESSLGFDPVIQGNVPYGIFSHDNCSVLRMGSITRMDTFAKAELTPEFLGFLESLKNPLNPETLLLINLENKSVDEEKARVVAFEGIRNKYVHTLNLPKSGDFYNQSGSYKEEMEGESFIKLFYEELSMSNETKTYVKKILPWIHGKFFDKKEILTRKDRLDFIEIAYLYIEMHAIETLKPDMMGFVSKDGLDRGASSLFAFSCFAKLSKNEVLNDLNFAESLLYEGSFTQRDRLIDVQCLSRVVSALSTLHSGLLH